jgi:hypothetical protein
MTEMLNVAVGNAAQVDSLPTTITTEPPVSMR